MNRQDKEKKKWVDFCFYPGCKISDKKYRQERKKLGLKAIPSFQGPKNDEDLLEKWKDVLRFVGVNKEFTEHDRLCALHFEEEDIDAYHEIKLFDGTIWRQEKCKKHLRPKSVPCIFPGREPDDSPDDPTQSSEKRKGSPLRESESKRECTSFLVKKAENEPSIVKGSKHTTLSSTTTKPLAFKIVAKPTVISTPEAPEVIKTAAVLPKASPNVSKDANVVIETVHSANSTANSEVTVVPNVVVAKGPTYPFDIKMLKEESSVIFPWVKAQMRSCVAFIYWDLNMQLERWIIVDQNLHAKVYLKGIESKVLENADIHSLAILRDVLKRVESVPICRGVSKEQSGCRGFVEPTPYKRTCEKCRNYQRLQKECQRCLANSHRLYKKRQLLACTLRKNERLRKKIRKLEIKLNIKKKISSEFLTESKRKTTTQNSSMSCAESDSNSSMPDIDCDFTDSEAVPNEFVLSCPEEDVEAGSIEDPSARLVPLMTAKIVKPEPSSSRATNRFEADSLTAEPSGSVCEQAPAEYTILADADISSMPGLSGIVLSTMKKELYQAVRLNSGDLMFKSPALIKEEPVIFDDES